MQILDYLTEARRRFANFIQPKSGNQEINSSDFWIDRYRSGGNSGIGSYGNLADYKSSVIRELICEYGIQNIIDLGCGDGNQLLSMKLSNINYIGYDVSSQLIMGLQKKFYTERNYQFTHSHEVLKSLQSNFTQNIMAISQDVIYHLVDDKSYFDHLILLAQINPEYILIYSTNLDWGSNKQHVRDRMWTRDLKTYLPVFTLTKLIHNPFYHSTGANFYLLSRVEKGGAKLI